MPASAKPRHCVRWTWTPSAPARSGESRTPRIGVNLDQAYTDPGAKIKDVTADSPADKAGLKTGDIIVRVNGRSIDDSTELVVEIRNHAPGDTVEIEFTRNGQDQTASLVLTDDSVIN